MSTLIQHLKVLYSESAAPSLEDLRTVYSDSIVFKDPIHTIEGISPLHAYLVKQAANITSCSFDYVDELIGQEKAYIHWQMTFSHPQLQRGLPITLPGVSKVFFREKIFLQEDFYDVGALVYEHVPVVGYVNRKLKQRMALS